jgi:FtsH-binding integral membrane protein
MALTWVRDHRWSIAAVLFAMLVYLTLPMPAFAQDIISEIDGYANAAIENLRKFYRWVWIATGGGLLIYGIVYALQAAMPSVWQTLSQWGKGLIFVVVCVHVGFQIAMTQAGG